MIQLLYNFNKFLILFKNEESNQKKIDINKLSKMPNDQQILEILTQLDEINKYNNLIQNGYDNILYFVILLQIK